MVPGGLWGGALGFPGASPGGQPHPSRRPKQWEMNWFHLQPSQPVLGTQGPGLRHKGGAGVLWCDHTGWLPSITSLGAPSNLKSGGQGCFCLPEKTDLGPHRGQDLPGVIQPPKALLTANPRPAHLATVLVAVYQG